MHRNSLIQEPSWKQSIDLSTFHFYSDWQNSILLLIHDFDLEKLRPLAIMYEQRSKNIFDALTIQSKILEHATLEDLEQDIPKLKNIVQTNIDCIESQIPGIKDWSIGGLSEDLYSFKNEKWTQKFNENRKQLRAFKIAKLGLDELQEIITAQPRHYIPGNESMTQRLFQRMMGGLY